ncbi:hypothetical protein K504DRAFT_477844 [Pleomassaria siparia CBS 279.74]|uniref:very-long-chain enoyl-CoA reductase n=1 Tax=Pleomassaria siparia CBS 279.74 TaxID=1314801 RepID=A0A6G1K7S8_9PLEO|nr:hypothetical protein K504DRAFT_477844 [Pleomassaria siparia CBS 279.74]
MAVLDLLPHCVSGVYLVYHSDFEKWSFGKLSALREASLTIESGYQYYYMGFYIHSCPKMRYKGEYSPQYVLDPETYEWNPLDGELRELLDRKPYVSLSRERRLKTDKSAPTSAEDTASNVHGASDGNDLAEYLHPTAAEGGDAVRDGMSLFELKVPGVMTVEEVEEKVQLDQMAVKVRGAPPGVKTCHLRAWQSGDIRDSTSIKGVIGEMVASIKNLPETIEVDSNEPAAQIFQNISKAAKFPLNRLRVTKGSDGTPISNTRDLTVFQTGLRNRSQVDVKDLGPQIAWRTVFIIEYLGPILIHPLVYYGRPLIYGTSEAASQLQKLTMILVVLHFLKREYETIFVHRFSLASMPARNIFKNSAHYWIFSGINLAYWVYAPSSPTASPSNPLITYAGLALFAIGEVCNLITHITLKGLRREGSTERGIPNGLGFNMVTCPNYMFETMAWVGIWLVSWSLCTGLFLVIALVQMMLWAKKKERRYRKEFKGSYRPKRYGVLPGIY